MGGPGVQAVLLSAGVATVVGALGAWLVRLATRQPTVRAAVGAALAAPLVVVLAVAAGIYASARAMLLSEHDSGLVLLGLLATIPVAVAAGWVIARHVQVLGQAVARAEEMRVRDQLVEERRRELVAWISHDLRSPLAAMRAVTEALDDGVTAEPAAAYAQLGREIERLDSMVGDLLDLSRITAGDVARHRELLDLSDLVSDVVAAARPVAAAAAVEVTASMDGTPSMGGTATPRGGTTTEGRTTALVDPRELTRAVDNLVSNAVRHTRPGSVVVVALSAEGGDVAISVSDGCGGIPEDILPRLFEPGFRASPSRTPSDAAGAGLGLAIVEAIVEAHGGSVSVRNSGPGCRFEIRLPRVSRTEPERRRAEGHVEAVAPDHD
jgi:signal transduction histidine kinase